MSFPRQLYEFLKAASVAHAKWDYEVSMSIIKSRKKLLVLFVLLMPILAVTLLQAADMIGGKTAYAPAHYSNLIFVVSIAVGLAAGLITGCIGGEVYHHPALMAAGGIAVVQTYSISSRKRLWEQQSTRNSATYRKLAIAFL
jgi:hypothetical protein